MDLSFGEFVDPSVMIALDQVDVLEPLSEAFDDPAGDVDRGFVPELRFHCMEVLPVVEGLLVSCNKISCDNYWQY